MKTLAEQLAEIRAEIQRAETYLTCAEREAPQTIGYTSIARAAHQSALIILDEAQALLKAPAQPNVEAVACPACTEAILRDFDFYSTCDAHTYRPAPVFEPTKELSITPDEIPAPEKTPEKTKAIKVLCTVATRAGLPTSRSKAMYDALSRFCGREIRSRYDLSLKEINRATDAIEGHLLGWAVVSQ